MKKLLLVLSILITLPLAILAQEDTSKTSDSNGADTTQVAETAGGEDTEDSGASETSEETVETEESPIISDLWVLIILLTVITFMLVVIRGISYSIADLNKRVEEAKSSTGANAAKALLTLIAFGATLTASAQPEIPNTGQDFVLTDTMLGILVFVTVFLFITILLLRNAYKSLAKLMHEHGYTNVPQKLNIINSLHLTDRVDVDKEELVMLDHNYDGIRELDNNLPPWWKYLFYATILFSVVYLIRFHVTGTGPSSEEEYIAQMEAALANKAESMADEGEQITEDNVVYVVEAKSLEKGAAIYKGNCATCHGDLGEGGTGPNLTDEYWIHGGSMKDIFSTIKYGVPEKGMIPWESQMSPENMQAVASYIKSIAGSNPPGAKDPQGEIYVGESEEIGTDSTTVIMEKEAKPE